MYHLQRSIAALHHMQAGRHFDGSGQLCRLLSQLDGSGHLKQLSAGLLEELLHPVHFANYQSLESFEKL